MHVSRSGRALAIAAGLACAYGGLSILLGDAISSPARWTISNWQTIIMVVATIAFGHFMVDAWRERRLPSTAGFLLLFLSGTMLVVWSSVGRQAETAGVTTLAAQATNEAIDSARSNLEAAERSLWQITAEKARECTGAPDPLPPEGWPKCRRLTGELEAITDRIAKLEGKSSAPKRPVNAEAEHMAAFLALFGLDKDKTMAVLSLVKPFATTLFFEIGSIVSLGFAFRHGPRPIPLPAPVQTAIALPVERRQILPPTGGTKTKQEALADLLTLMALGEEIPSQDWLKERWKVGSKGTISKWITEWEQAGLVARASIGKCKTVEYA